jgi:4a-hydroxytetrahydrobiopterin dehydratase
MDDDDARPTRQQISDAVDSLGWRLVQGAIQTQVLTPSLVEAAEAASLSVSAVGTDGHGHLTVDIRPDRAVLRLWSADTGGVTGHDIRLAHEVSGALTARGMPTTPGAWSLQSLEIAIDALAIPAVRPFWKAITGYLDEPGPSDLSDGLIDPTGRGPAIWFQQMDAPRPQRNRIHLDIDVPHDAAQERIDAALAAGGTLLSDQAAPAFWVLADPEGNEACICTWQGRD